MTPRPLEEVVKDILGRVDARLIYFMGSMPGGSSIFDELRASLAEREKESVAMNAKHFVMDANPSSSGTRNYVYVDSPRKGE